jgi:hypothetical protein
MTGAVEQLDGDLLRRLLQPVVEAQRLVEPAQRILRPEQRQLVGRRVGARAR